MDVFEAFPDAIVSNVWQIGENAYSTDTGNSFSPIAYCDVIIDEEEEVRTPSGHDAAALETGTLIYARPAQLPSTSVPELLSRYLWKNTETGQLYEIRSAGVGKNQESGQIEHLEMKIRAIGDADEQLGNV